MLKEALKVRYIRLRFQVKLLENTELPEYKSFALRGGIGEMLLRQNCVYHRERCAECYFREECIVKRTMYARPEIPIPFMNQGESLGYNLECTNDRRFFKKNEILEFHLVLFGKCIAYFWQYLQAVHALGIEGIGKAKARFRLYQVLNIHKQPIFSEGCVNKNAYQWETLGEYVGRRMNYLKNDRRECGIQFLTPATLKYQGEFLRRFHSEAFIKAVWRRIYMMDCFEGLNIGQIEYQGEMPVTKSENSNVSTVRRYSSTQNRGIYLKGLEGRMELEGVSEFILACILAGEVLHVGKNSSFGFGLYRVHMA